MATVVLTVAVFAGAMAAMAVGVILSNRELHGSCGGTGKDCVCEIEKRRACAQFKPKSRLSVELGELGSGAGRQQAWRD